MNTRFHDISLLRVTAMLLVVYYHCICPYYIWGDPLDSAGISVPLYMRLSLALNHVHLPIFFLIAGYLFGYKRVRGGMPISGSSLSIKPNAHWCPISR